jgi:hypothetical protein
MKIYSFQNEMIFKKSTYFKFYSIQYLFWFFNLDIESNNRYLFQNIRVKSYKTWNQIPDFQIVFHDKIIHHNLKTIYLQIKTLCLIQVKKGLKILNKLMDKKLNSFDIYIYQVLLNYHINVNSEKIWLNFFNIKNWISEIFEGNFKFFKNKESLISFRFFFLIWPLIETYLTNLSQYFFYCQMSYLNFNYSFLFKKKLCSYSCQLYCFLVCNNFVRNRFFLETHKNKLTDYFSSYFKKRQIFKKLLLQFSLMTHQESTLSLTSHFSTTNRTIYDSVEYLYEILKNKTIFTFRIDLITNFRSLNANSILHEKFNFFSSSYLLEKKNNLNKNSNNYSRLCFLFLSKIHISNSIYQNQPFYFLKNQLCRKFEKYNLYTYYRSYCKDLTFPVLSYKPYNTLIQFKNSFLQVCENQKSIIEHSVLFSKYIVKFGVQFLQSQIVHSKGQKAGFFFYGFYFIQKNKISKQNLKSCTEKNKIPFYIQILPSKFYLKQYLKQLKQIIKKSTIYSQELLIKKLRNKIESWIRYYQISTSKKIFNFCDFILFKWLWKWARRRHPNKNQNWVKKKYFLSEMKMKNKTKWFFCFYNPTKKIFLCLPEHQKVNLVRHLKIRHYIANYDENWKYRFKRLS